MRDEVRADALLASLEQEHRGKLKVFLGAAPGVGKTYAMLQAVREQAREGVDIPDRGGGDPRPPGDPGPARQARHPAAHTAPAPPAAAGGDGSGRSAGAQARHRRGGRAGPQQRPGSRHEKRWQDVEELLGAGIDVYTTLNVQHLESLNDLVWQLTGVRVKETLPDQVLLEADSLVLIDLPPRSCSAASRRARSMCPTRPRPPCSLFSLNNLTALRELAMQTAASHVEGDLQLQWQAAGKTTCRCGAS